MYNLKRGPESGGLFHDKGRGNGYILTFGDKRLYGLCQKLAAKESNEFVNLLVRALDEHKGNAPQHDDMTIVTVRVTG